MTRHLLVNWPDDGPLPPGTYAHVEIGAPNRYAAITDPATFGEWARRHGYVDPACGHVPHAVEKALRERVMAEPDFRPPGMELRQDGGVRLRAWPIEPLWSSAVDVVKE